VSDQVWTIGHIYFHLVHGLSQGDVKRDMKPGLQMGEYVKRSEPKFVQELVLPKIYPSHDTSFTRHRSPQDIFWDLVLEKFDEKLKQMPNK
jgi:hypothetical protein